MAFKGYKQLGSKYQRIFKFWKTRADYYRLSIPLRSLKKNYTFEALPVICIENEIEDLKKQMHETRDLGEYAKIELLVDYLVSLLEKYKFEE